MPGVARRDKPLKGRVSIDELLNSDISNPTEGDLLAYVNGAWRNAKALTGDYDITGQLDVTGLETSGNAAVGGILSVAGDAALAAALSVAGATTLTGAATLNDTLDVTGAATFASTLSVAGVLSGAAGFSVSGDSTLTGDLDVSGTLTADSISVAGLSLSGDLTAANLGLSGDASVTGDVIVGGQLTSGVALGAPIVGGATGAFSDTLTLAGADVLVDTDGLNALADVTLTSEAAGETLYYDGSGWVNDDTILVTPGTDVTIADDLVVEGTTGTGINLILNESETGSPTLDAGIYVERGTSDNSALKWNEADDQWEFTNDGSTDYPLLPYTPSTPATGEVLYYDGADWVNTDALSLDPAGAATLSYNGTAELRTAQHNAADHLSGAEARDYSGNFRPVGFLDMPSADFSADFTAVNAHWGKVLRQTAGSNLTMTLPDDSDVPASVTVTVLQGVSGTSLTIAEGAGVTLRWANGASVTTGNRTLAYGGVATVWKLTDTIYYVWGWGIS